MASPANHGRAGRPGIMDLQPLDQSPGFAVADESPDVRGWTVRGVDDGIGRVAELLVDRQRMTARYLIVDVEAGAVTRPRRVLLPVSRVGLDETSRSVRSNLSRTQIDALPPYTGAVPATYDQMLPPAGPGGREMVHEADRVAGTQQADDDVTRVTGSAEELRIGRREVQAGAVGVSTQVETDTCDSPSRA